MYKQFNNLGTEKIIPDNSDFIPIQQVDGITRRINRANLLSGLLNTEYFNYLCFLAHFTGADNSTTITDSKGATITRHGNSKISTTQSKFGSGALFLDGAGDYLSFPYSSFTDICSGDDFRLELFFYPLSLTNTRSIIGQWKQVTGSGGFLLQTIGTSLSFSFGAFSETSALLTGGTLTVNTWHHIAVTKIGSKFTLWLNGIAVASAATFNSRVLTSVSYSIGNYYNNSGILGASGNVDLHGYLNELRIIKPKPYLLAVPTQAFSDS